MSKTSKQSSITNFFSKKLENENNITNESFFDNVPVGFYNSTKTTKLSVGRPRKTEIIELPEEEENKLNEIDLSNLKNTNKKIKWTEIENKILKSFMHLWGKDNSHIGWDSVENVIIQYKKLFPNACYQTIKNKCSMEHKEFDKKGDYLKEKPNLQELIHFYQQEKDNIYSIHSEITKSGAPVILDHSLFPIIIEKVEKFKNSPGFGIRTVRTITSIVYHEQFKGIFN